MSTVTRLLLLVGVAFVLGAVTIGGLSWLSMRSSGRALARWREQNHDAGPLKSYCPQVDDLYWDGVEEPARWKP